MGCILPRSCCADFPPSHCKVTEQSSALFSRFNTPAPKFSIKAQAPEEKGACSEHLASAGSTTRGGSVEEPAGSLGSVRDPAQEPAHADDSLEAKVDVPVHLCLHCPPLGFPRKSSAHAKLPFCCPESGLGRRASDWTRGLWGGETVLLGEAPSDPSDLC